MRIQRNISLDVELDRKLREWIEASGGKLSQKLVFNGMVWSFLNRLTEDQRFDDIRSARDLSLNQAREIAKKAISAVERKPRSERTNATTPAVASSTPERAGGERAARG